MNHLHLGLNKIILYLNPIIGNNILSIFRTAAKPTLRRNYNLVIVIDQPCSPLTEGFVLNDEMFTVYH